jgi:hypothetical protein
MRPRLLALAAFVATASIVTVPERAAAAKECNGVQRCIPVEGPWVAVPADGEVEYELMCPKGQGVVAGTDGLASSIDVHVSFDGILGAPIAYGRTTNSAMLFRGVSGRHRPGSFKPFIGCIPTPSSVRNTVAAPRSPVGPPLKLKSRLVGLSGGSEKVVTIACPAGDSLVDSWSTPAFETSKAPNPALAAAITARTTISGRMAKVAISTSEALPAGSHAELQIGVRCAEQ